MKKANFILMLLTLFSLNEVHSQIDIKLESLDGELVNGTTVEFVQNSGSINVHMFDFYIVNNTGSTQDWMITRKTISEPTSWSNYLCWGGLCYPPHIENVWNSNVGTVVSGESKVLNTYVSSPNVGNCHYRYYVSNDGLNFIDSVDVIVDAVLGVESIVNDPLEVSVYPNPTKGVLKIKMNNIKNAELTIYDVSGKVVLNKTIIQNMSVLDISFLKEGSYFYTIKDLNSNYMKREVLIVID